MSLTLIFKDEFSGETLENLGTTANNFVIADAVGVAGLLWGANNLPSTALIFPLATAIARTQSDSGFLETLAAKARANNWGGVADFQQFMEMVLVAAARHPHAKVFGH